jgi:hypothetical protein
MVKYGAKYAEQYGLSDLTPGRLPGQHFSAKLYSIKSRCENRKNCSYSMYGAKGIKCKMFVEDLIYLWKKDKAWMLDFPTIDRIDSKKDYELSNCRFIERKENAILSVLTKMKPVNQYDLNWKFIKTYPSITATLKDNFNERSIWRCINGKMKKHHGYRWKLSNMEEM